MAAALVSELTLGLATRAAANPLTVAPGVFVSEEYNDNIFFQPQKVDDYITVVGFRLNVGYQTQSSNTTLSLGVSGNYFARRTVATVDLAQGQSLRSSTSYRYSERLSFTINERLARLNSSARGLGFINSGGTTTGDVTAQDPAQVNPGDVNLLLPSGSALTNSFGLTASYLLAPLWTGGLSYTNGVSNFTDPNSTNLTNRVGGHLSYQWSEPLSLNGNYTYSRFNASNAPDSEGHTVTVGAGYTPAPLWSMFGSVGASLNRSVGSSNTSTRTSAAFSLGLDRQFERSSLSLGAQQGLTPSAGIAGASTTIGGYVSYDIQLTEYLSGALHSSYSNFDTTSGSFDVYQARAALFYPVWRNITAALVYAYRRRDSSQSISNTLQAGTVDGNIVLIQVGTTFQLWQLDV